MLIGAETRLTVDALGSTMASPLAMPNVRGRSRDPTTDEALLMFWQAGPNHLPVHLRHH